MTALSSKSFLAAVLGLLALLGCGGTSAPLVILNLNPSSPQSLHVNQKFSITSSVQNYSGSTPLNVTWSLTCGGGDCGTVAPNYTVVGQAVIYTAPASPPPATVTLTADLLYGHSAPPPVLTIDVLP